MFHLLLKVLFILTFFEYLTAIIKDPCNEEMSQCSENKTHVRCNYNGKFSRACKGTYKLVDLRKYRSLILDKHNEYRDYVASGELEGFPPADRMPAIRDWDPELALNAEVNVKSCVFEHDECRNTEKYRYAGQNIYEFRSTNVARSIAAYIEKAIDGWFEEYKDADAELMQSYRKTEPKTGHFTLMVCDRQTALGCAMLDNRLPGRKRILIFTCDYSSNNLRGMPTYKAGPAASECKKADFEYPSLCDSYKIDANDVSRYNEV